MTAGLDPGNRLPDVPVEVVDGLRRPLGLEPGLALDALAEVVVPSVPSSRCEIARERISSSVTTQSPRV
jgi:hypothetical protein